LSSLLFTSKYAVSTWTLKSNKVYRSTYFSHNNFVFLRIQTPRYNMLDRRR
jgi:hypothetical protein